MSVRRSTARTLIGVLMAPAVLVVVGAAGHVAAAEAESHVRVVQTPAPVQGPCLPPPLALSRTVHNTPESFTLRIVASAPPCPPVTAAAVVYAMPGNGQRWPQELRERVEFTIAEAGVTEVVFAKHCEPVQFDVITGASPQTISPIGDWHGPLLFPFDTGTALQHSGGGEGCDGTTTSTSTASTTTTTAPSSTTTSEPEVLGSTTLPGGGVVTTVPLPDVVPVSVGGAVQTPSAPASLALTGTSRSVTGALAGVALVLIGAALVLTSRRRPRSA